jgi:hypothetical protein
MKAFSDYCIYTIVHRDRLARAARKGGCVTFREGRRWVTGHQLWREAKHAGTVMPVLLADAAWCSRLLYWGVLTAVKPSGAGTTFTVDRLRKFLRPRRTQELVLRSKCRHIAPHFIKPYAICRTPRFVIK